MYGPPMKGLSEGSGAMPLRGRRGTPGSRTVAPRPLTKQMEPSGEGAFSKAVRSATSPPGK